MLSLLSCENASCIFMPTTYVVGRKAKENVIVSQPILQRGLKCAYALYK